MDTPGVNDCQAGVERIKPEELPLTSPSLPVTMSFAGKYQLESQENFEPFMKAIGKIQVSLNVKLFVQSNKIR